MKKESLQLLNENLNVDDVVKLFADFDSSYTKDIKNGYFIECFIVPIQTTKRLVGGLSDITITREDKTIIFNSPKKYIAYLALMIVIEYSFFTDKIENITLNGKIISSLTFEDLIEINCDIVNISFCYKNLESAIESNCSVFYLVSPYKQDYYYLEKEMKRIQEL